MNGLGERADLVVGVKESFRAFVVCALTLHPSEVPSSSISGPSFERNLGLKLVAVEQLVAAGSHAGRIIAARSACIPSMYIYIHICLGVETCIPSFVASEHAPLGTRINDPVAKNQATGHADYVTAGKLFDKVRGSWRLSESVYVCTRLGWGKGEREPELGHGESGVKSSQAYISLQSGQMRRVLRSSSYATVALPSGTGAAGSMFNEAQREVYSTI